MALQILPSSPIPIAQGATVQLQLSGGGTVAATPRRATAWNATLSTGVTISNNGGNICKNAGLPSGYGNAYAVSSDVLVRDQAGAFECLAPTMEMRFALATQTQPLRFGYRFTPQTNQAEILIDGAAVATVPCTPASIARLELTSRNVTWRIGGNAVYTANNVATDCAYTARLEPAISPSCIGGLYFESMGVTITTPAPECVTWQIVSGSGSLDAQGLLANYTAPLTAGSATVKASYPGLTDATALLNVGALIFNSAACGSTVVAGTTVIFEGNGGFAADLDADGGIIVNAHTWIAPEIEGTYHLTYSANGATSECVIEVVRRLEVAGVVNGCYGGLFPGDTVRFRATCPGAVYTCTNYPELCDATGYLRTLGDRDGASFGGRIYQIKVEGCGQTLSFEVCVDPVYPTPAFEGPDPVKWLQIEPKFFNAKSEGDLGCKTYTVQSDTPEVKWKLDYAALDRCPLEIPAGYEPICNDETRPVGARKGKHENSDRLDAFYTLVRGDGYPFWFVDESGKRWAKVHFANYKRDHRDYDDGQIRNVELIWSPCCAEEPDTSLCGDSVTGTGGSGSGGSGSGGNGGGGLTGTAPNTPTALTATAAGANRIDLSWEDVMGETGYVLERSTDGANWAAIATLPADSTAYSDTSAMPSTTYSYRIRAVNAAGTSPNSGTATATTAPIIVPPASINIPFNVTATGLPIQLGVPVKQSPALLSTNPLRLVNAAGVTVPATIEVRSRWGGLVTDTSKPIKWLAVNFTPNGTGGYTIKNDIAGAVPSPSVTVTPGSLIVDNGSLKLRAASTGADLFTEFKLNGIEQLAGAAKPRLTMQVEAKARLIQNTGVTGATAAPSGQDKITVDFPQAFQVGHQVEFKKTAIYRGFGNDYIGDYLNIEAENGYLIGNGEFAPDHQFIFARGTANQFTLTTYKNTEPGNSLYSPNQYTLYRETGDGFPTGTMPLGALIEDEEARTAGTYTVLTINGNEITLSGNLSKRLLIGCEVVNLTTTAPFNADFKVQSATVVQSSAAHAIIRQDGWWEVGTTRVWPYLTGTVYWYAYANHSFVRGRLHVNNKTDVIADAPKVNDANLRELKLVLPFANSVTASSDSVTTHSGAGSASERVLAGQSDSVAVVGAVKYASSKFAEKYPQALVASGTTITHSIMPVLSNGYQNKLYKHHANVWDFYLGVGADNATKLTSGQNATLNAQYAYESKAISPVMAPPRKTWTVADFNGSARQAEAANLFERMMASGWDVNQNDSAAAIAPAERMSLYEWRAANHLWPGASNDNGLHFGVHRFGNIADIGGDGYGNTRYDLTGNCLIGWVRTGDAKAERLGYEMAAHLATMGICQSAASNGGYNWKGGAWWEKSNDGIISSDIPKTTHFWVQGLALYWAITGDPISKQSLDLMRGFALEHNYSGVGGQLLDYNEIRSVARPAKALTVFYEYFGNESDLTKARQYLDNIRQSELSVGGKGWWRSPLTPTSPIQAFHQLGYGSDGFNQYIGVKQLTRNETDADIEACAVRFARWGVFGDSSLNAPGNNAPLIYQDASGSPLIAAGATYDWYPGGTTTGASFEVAQSVVCLGGLTNAARLQKCAALRLMAQQVFEALAFYRDAVPANYTLAFRQPLSFRNRNYFGTSTKVWGQMMQAAQFYLWDAERNTAALPPTLTNVTPATAAHGSANVLTLTGAGFVTGAEVSIGGVVGLVPSAISGTSITVTLPANALPAGNHPVMVTNANGGYSQLVTITLT